MNECPVLFVLGPTASGKTELAAALRGEYDAEIISVDAAQVYRGFDIGSGKPDAAFLRRHPHHLIDIRAPNETYNAAAFCDDALRLIARIRGEGKLPILVGGTMFYFAALEHGLSDLPSADPAVRARIARMIERDGLDAAHQRLARIDTKAAAAISRGDAQRIGRTLEIHELTAEAPSTVMARSTAKPLPYPLIKIGLFDADRGALHARIAARFARMLERGLVDEVRRIVAQLDDPQTQPCMRAVGYRQVHDYINGKLSFDAMTARAIAATRQLAKRQLTWMRQQRNLVWVDRGDADAVHAYLRARIG